MYLLDTDVLSWLQRGHERVLAHVHAASDPELATSIISWGEIIRARIEFMLRAASGEELQRAQSWLELSEELFKKLTVITIDRYIAEQFERLRLQPGLGRVGRADLLIACVAIAHDATLVTRNTKDFARIPGLRLENWVDD